MFNIIKKKHLAGFLSSIALYKLLSYLKSRYKNRKYLQKAKKKQFQKLSAIPLLAQISPDQESFILSLSITQLSSLIHSRSLTSEELVTTYIKRALSIGRSLNLTAEELFDSALSESKKCDLELSLGHSRGPLHGIPFSVKDHFSMKNCQSTIGLCWKLDYTDDETFILIEILKSKGGIPFVRSNVPQGMMWIESKNKIYGKALNPWNQSKTPGGSSGGEAGLISARASPIGVGSDCSGSIRVPCNFCGVYGFVPTSQRLPKAWISGSVVHTSELHEPVLEFSYGPLGRTVDDLVMILECWLSEDLFKQIGHLTPICFDKGKYLSEDRLKIGFFYGNDLVPVSSCISEAIQKCQSVLGKNCEVALYEFPQFNKLCRLFNRLISVGGNETLFSNLKGEDPEDYFDLMIFSNDHPYFTSAVMKILKLFGQARLTELFELPSIHTSSEFLELFRDIQNVALDVVNDWNQLGFSAVVCPVFGLPAMDHGKAVEVVPGVIYSTVWNLLGFCAGVVPVGLVSESQAFYRDLFNDLMTSSYNEIMTGSEGLPFALQVVSLPYQDETALNVMKRVEGIFDFHKFSL